MKIDVTYVNGVPDQFTASHGEQIKNEIQNAISCSQVPNPADSFQLSKHIAMASMVNDYCIDSGVANSYIAQVSGSYQNPPNLTTGMEIKLNALNTNTGASTLNLSSLGAKDIKKSDGVTDIDAGDIIVGDNYLKYNGTCWCLKSAVFDELSAKTQETSDNSNKVATTKLVENKINSKGFATVDFTDNNLVNYGNVSEAILEMPTLTSKSGTTITAYAGTKLLLADGLNADRSYKHKIYTTPSNLTCNATAWGSTMFGFIMWQMNLDGTGEGIYFVNGESVAYEIIAPTPATGKRYKNTVTNKWYWCKDGSTWTEIYAYNLGIASINYSTSTIHMWKPKTVTDLKIDDNLYTFQVEDLINLGYRYKYCPRLNISYHVITKQLTIDLFVGDSVNNQEAVFKFPELIKAPSGLLDIGGLGCGLYNYATALPIQGRINTSRQYVSSHTLNQTANGYTYAYSGMVAW
jgi:hypothetical protein